MCNRRDYPAASVDTKHAELEAFSRSHLEDWVTSVVARGKIIMAAGSGEQIPSDWAIDKDGVATRDAQAALEVSVLPIGDAKATASRGWWISWRV